MTQTATTPARDFVPYTIQKAVEPNRTDDFLVYVAYCPDGLLSPLHLRCLAAYHAEGYRLALVVNSGADSHQLNPGTNPASITIVRENIGFDFGGWGHAARLIPGLENARSVTFVNDSLIGPLPGDGSTELRATVDEVEGDVVFMTESVQIRPHGQSYFFALKRSALEKGALQLVRDSLYFSSTKRVVLNEELTLAARLQQLGLTTRAAFPCPEALQHACNPTFFFWDYLISTGFPFVKVSLIPDGKVSIDDPELASIIGPEYLSCLRAHLARRPAHAPLFLGPNPS